MTGLSPEAEARLERVREQVAEAEPRPVLTDIDGKRYMVIGASPQAIQSLGSMVKFVSTMSGSQVFAGLMPGVGILVKLGAGSFAISPELADEARERYGIARRANG
ncbi:MAG: hypothetical protein LBR58_11275 [Propionibacteriaceae bacterium]|jgi:hypothetical protein|nr:hypothetical protein [Propionibacteriaceae bacterium]